MNMMNLSECVFAIATEQDLNRLFSGHEAGITQPSSVTYKPTRLAPGAFGVVYKHGHGPSDAVQPLVLVSRKEDLKRLFGRFAHLRDDYSPVTAWCHILTPEQFDSLESLTKDAEFEGFEASWSGLAIAEAQLLTGRPLFNLGLSACLAAQSFAIGRAKSLWRSTGDIPARLDAANRLMRRSSPSRRTETRTQQVRAALRPIWQSLSAVSFGDPGPASNNLAPIASSLRNLFAARQMRDPAEAQHAAAPLVRLVPEADRFTDLTALIAEDRLRIFDKLMNRLASTEERSVLQRTATAFLGGYLVTVAAGGAPSLTLAEDNLMPFPEVMAWAYVVGGVGERIVWTSSFDGLGRLVARELTRPLRLDEPPVCDIALDEVEVLVDSKLSDPLVHLRIKQGRLATVALLPGVNCLVPLSDSVSQEKPESEGVRSSSERPEASRRISPSPFPVLADALWPHLQPRIDEYLRRRQDAQSGSTDWDRSRGKRNRSAQGKLPYAP